MDIATLKRVFFAGQIFSHAESKFRNSLIDIQQARSMLATVYTWDARNGVTYVV